MRFAYNALIVYNFSRDRELLPNQRIRKTKLDRFMGRLMTILNRLDQAVEVKVTIRPRSRSVDKSQLGL